MSYKCEDILVEKYKELKSMLTTQKIECEIHMIRNYMIKLTLSKEDNNLGRLVIYYSPKKDSYSYKRDNDMEASVFEYIIDLIDGKSTSDLIEIINNSQSKNEDTNSYKIYVDGSYMNNRIGYGAVILKDNKPIKELYGEVTDDYAIQSRQVGGEIVAVQEGLRWCGNEGIKDVSIYYDFQNLEKWATGEYKTNNTLSQRYKSFIDSCEINIKWYKVKSHTGVKWNERADELAKLGISKEYEEISKEEASKDIGDKELKRELEIDIKNILEILKKEGYDIKLNDEYHKNYGKIEIYWNK